MNILLFGEAPGSRRILNKMLKGAKHHLVQQAWEEMPEPDLENYDLVLVDGNVGDCAQQTRLLEWVRTARCRFPNLPVAALNDLGASVTGTDAEHHPPHHSCGIAEAADGVWYSHCRLKSLALSETAALLRDACERPLLEPIVFEYSGKVEE
ncbi:MAG: hypothetical protein Q7S51_00800 [Gallionellaceae bacterium]|nr:hypothetical protein [Gallionellaceae bacterium]